RPGVPGRARPGRARRARVARLLRRRARSRALRHGEAVARRYRVSNSRILVRLTVEANSTKGAEIHAHQHRAASSSASHDAGKGLSSVPRRGRDGQMASAERVHRQGPPRRRVGGTYKMSFTNFSSGHSHSFGGAYLELVPNERIRHTDKFDDPQLPGE